MRLLDCPAMPKSNAAKLVTELVTETADQPQTDLQLVALTNLCKASADTLRLLVLRVLRTDSFGVSELCSIFDIRQPALSHHLKVLANAGLVAARREANSIFYRRSELGQDPHLEALQNSIFETVDNLALPADIEQRLAVLQQQREENSANFFRNNAPQVSRAAGSDRELRPVRRCRSASATGYPTQATKHRTRGGPGRRLLSVGTRAAVQAGRRAGQRAGHAGTGAGKSGRGGVDQY